MKLLKQTNQNPLLGKPLPLALALLTGLSLTVSLNSLQAEI